MLMVDNHVIYAFVKIAIIGCYAFVLVNKLFETSFVVFLMIIPKCDDTGVCMEIVLNLKLELINMATLA